MVKYCAFISCKSGSKSERKKYNDINIQQTSLHKIPKDPNKLKQLSLGLCQDLVPEKYVCELHFHNKDILKSDNILLPNSVIHTSRLCIVIIAFFIAISKSGLLFLPRVGC
ncbi:uncharacterized protein LOC122515409 isoform X4 [Polistes fuscatus]|uniref:uncharacterized protein LOC122515409 isoform X4 n=1 Tax=Polistes fuscatus TaxID=30207 RepID=UPI001CA84181|nr:uncharacterized protein LOC122515409 isoform X4 [Polistes fuscatus]